MASCGGEAPLRHFVSFSFPTLLLSFALFYLLFVSLSCLYIDLLIFTFSAEPDNMASEPTEEAITSFVSFTSTTREQAIAFLKVRDCHWVDKNISANLLRTGKQPGLPESDQRVLRRSDRVSAKGKFGDAQQILAMI